MQQIVQVLVCAVIGLGLAALFGVSEITNASWYQLFVSILLGVGLYCSTFGIDITEARKHLRIILSAVTVGVLLKALIIGGLLALLFHNPFFLILGVVVAQIDPLSVAALMQGKRLSAKAKTILGAWASFDDPITVILALYIPFFVGQVTGSQWPSITGDTHAGALSYLGELATNVGFAAGALVIWFGIKHYFKRHATAGSFGLLALAFPVAVLNFWMLAVALLGLFARPPIQRFVEPAVRIALCLAVLLGALLFNGIHIVAGLALGAAAYGAQIIVGFLLTHGLPAKDRYHIAFAQQNGITAIILALLFEPLYPGTVAIVAPAILVVNILHAVVNKLYDTWTSR